MLADREMAGTIKHGNHTDLGDLEGTVECGLRDVAWTRILGVTSNAVHLVWHAINGGEFRCCLSP